MPPDTAEAISTMTPAAKARAPITNKNKTRLPKPKQYKYVGAKKIIEFFEWWKSFTEEQAGCSELKVYRKYPVIDLILIPGNKHKERIDVIEGVIPFEPEEYTSYFLHHYGSGRYSLVMDEKGVPGIVSGCVFEIDDPNYPARVDYKSLVVGHPENRGYIEGLKARGVRLPWETDEEKTEGEPMNVAAGQLIDTIVQTNRELASDNKELMNEVMQVREEAGSPGKSAQNESIKLIADTARESNHMLADTMKTLAAATTPSLNPIEILKTAVELTKPTGDNGRGLLELVINMSDKYQQSQAQMHKDTIEFMRQQTQTQTVEAPADPLDSLLAQVDKLQRLKDALGGGRRENPEPRESNGKGWVQALMENPKVVESIGLVGQLALTIMMRMNGIPAAVAPNPQPTVQPTQPATTKPAEPQPDPQTLAFQQYVEKPFLAHFFGEASGLNGYTFAAALQAEMMDIVTEPEIVAALKVRPMMQSGRQNYETIREKWGRKKLDEVLQSHPPIWNMIGGNRKKYGEFLDQFFNYDRWVEQQRSQPQGTPIEKPN